MARTCGAPAVVPGTLTDPHPITDALLPEAALACAPLGARQHWCRSAASPRRLHAPRVYRRVVWRPTPVLSTLSHPALTVVQRSDPGEDGTLQRAGKGRRRGVGRQKPRGCFRPSSRCARVVQGTSGAGGNGFRLTIDATWQRRRAGEASAGEAHAPGPPRHGRCGRSQCRMAERSRTCVRVRRVHWLPCSET